MTIFTLFFFFFFFFLRFWLQILNLPASLQNKNTPVGMFPWKRSVLQNPDRERTNQSTGICLRLGLLYNNEEYCTLVIFVWTSLCFIFSSTMFNQYSPVWPSSSSVSKSLIFPNCHLYFDLPFGPFNTQHES